MTDVIKCTPEYTERNDGEILAVRGLSIGKYRELGPPDLCILRKKKNNLGTFLKLSSEEVNYFHHVNGVDSSGPGAMCAYFQRLIQDALEPSFFASASWKVTFGTFCSYNALREVDVRVEMPIPGSVRFYAVDNSGKKYEVTAEMWEELLICSTLRNLAPIPSNLPIKVNPFELSSDNETSFLAAALKHYPKLMKLRCGQNTHPMDGAANIASIAIRNHFFRLSRFSQAAAFFRKLSENDPSMLVHVSAAHYAVGDADGCLSVLGSALESSPDSASIQTSIIARLIEKKEYHAALAVARRGIDVYPNFPSSWLNLASVYVALGAFDLALVALNVAPMPDDAAFEALESDFFDSDRVPASDSALMVGTLSPPPSDPTAAPGRSVPSWYWIHRNTMDSDEAYCAPPSPSPASASADEKEKEKDKVTPSIDPFIGSLSRVGILRRAYSVMIQMLASLGWDSLLDLRSSVFFMDGDHIDPSLANANAAKLAAETSRQLAEAEAHRFPVPKSKEEADSGSDAADEDVTEEDAEDADDVDSLNASGVLENGENSGEAAAASSSSASQPKKNSEKKEKEQEKEKVKAVPVPAVPAGPAPRLSKRLCARWLDSQFQQLYEDLRQLALWRAETEAQQAAEEKDGQQVSGGMSSSLKSMSSATAALKKLPHEINPASADEWYSRGRLAQRLGRPTDAELAHRMAIYKGLHLQSYHELLKLYARTGAVKEALLIAETLIKHYQSANDAEEGLAADALRLLHPALREAIFRLISVVGLDSVRKVQLSMGKQSTNIISDLLLDAVSVKVDNYAH